MFDSSEILKDFPLLQQSGADGKRICYLDSGATSQKPQAVIDAVTEYYEEYNANVHRGIYAISERALFLKMFHLFDLIIFYLSF